MSKEQQMTGASFRLPLKLKLEFDALITWHEALSIVCVTAIEQAVAAKKKELKEKGVNAELVIQAHVVTVVKQTKEETNGQQDRTDNPKVEEQSSKPDNGRGTVVHPAPKVAADADRAKSRSKPKKKES